MITAAATTAPTRRRNADLVDAGDPVDPRIPEVAFATEAWNDHVGVSRGDWWSDPRIPGRGPPDGRVYAASSVASAVPRRPS